MTTITQKVDRYELAFGLQWLVLQDPDQIDPVFETKGFAKERNTNHAVMLGVERKRPMAGLWMLPTRKPTRMTLSAAALAAHGFEGRRITVAALGHDRYWLSMTSNDGMLDPNNADFVGAGDVVTNKLDNAATAVSTTGNKNFRVTIVGDVTLESPWIRKANRIEWADLIASPDAVAMAKIGALTPVPWKWIGIAASVVIASGAWWGHREYTLAVAREADAAAKNVPSADMQRLRAARIQQVVASALAADTTTTAPVELTRWCAAAAQPIGWHYHGWRVTSIICDPVGSSIKAALTADYTGLAAPTPAALRRAVADYGARVEFAADLQSATLLHNLPPLTARAPLERAALPRFDQHAVGLGTAIADLRAGQERITATFGASMPKPLRFEDPTQRDPTTGKDIEVEVPASDSYFTTSIDLGADRIEPMLAAIAPYQVALRVDRVEFTPSPDRTGVRIVLTHFLQP